MGHDLVHASGFSKFGWTRMLLSIVYNVLAARPYFCHCKFVKDHEMVRVFRVMRKKIRESV